MTVFPQLLLLVAAAGVATICTPAAAFVPLRTASVCKSASVRPDGTVDGCISQFGDLRLSCGASCRRSEEAISWNAQGVFRGNRNGSHLAMAKL